jgi:uncharacterized protein
MSYLIDGHNLIPKIPGISLSDPDDEESLIQLLQNFCRQRSKRVEVYFDQAPPGNAGTRNFGMVNAFFIRQGQTADKAILRRLAALGKRAVEYTVVSSDQAVQKAARQARARVLSAEEFVNELQTAATLSNSQPEKPEHSLSQDEVENWLGLFNQNKPQGDKDQG